MNPTRLASILTRGRAFDLETYQVTEHCISPPPVCGAVAGWEGNQVKGVLLDKEQAYQALLLLLDSDAVIVGLHIAFDLLVMAVYGATVHGENIIPKIFRAYLEERIYDVGLAQGLDAIAGGHFGKDPNGAPMYDEKGKLTERYSLYTCTRQLTGRSNAKANDRWRKSYALLDGIPLAEWPLDAQTYPVDDGCNTFEDCLIQIGVLPRTDGTRRPNRNLHDLAHQCYKAWALWLGASWGLRTDPVATEELAAAAEAGRSAGLPDFIKVGFIRPDGSENQSVVKRAQAIAYGCSGTCEVCNGTSKVKSPKSGNPIVCVDCSGTGLDLSSGPVPMTDPSAKFPKGQVKIGRDELTESGDELLMNYAQYQEDDKIIDTYVPFLRKGYDAPICLRPNPLLTTGRVSYDGPVQLLPKTLSARLLVALARRGSKVIGVRDCIVPPPGWIIYSIDYVGGELVTHAESCLKIVGFSKMGEALNAGMDVHSDFAADLLGIPYKSFDKKNKRHNAIRGVGKVENFGNGGGMSAPTMVRQQRKQGPDTPCEGGPSMISDGKGGFIEGYKGLRFCVMVRNAKSCGDEKITEWKDRAIPPLCRACVEVADELREAWFRKWPENRPYFKHVSAVTEHIGEIVQHYSNRVRGGVKFTEAANGYFQSLLADIAGRAQCRVSYEQYCDPSSVLYGSRSVVFAHDELLGVCREEVGHEVAMRVGEIMLEEFRKGCPNHAKACKVAPALMKRWYKAAEDVWVDGRLVPWEPPTPTPRMSP